MGLYLKGKTKLVGTEGTRLQRENVSRGDPTGAKSAEEASRTARGKRVPGVEIDVSIL